MRGGQKVKYTYTYIIMTNLNIYIQSQIKATVESNQEFAVYFEDAWQWLDYSRKDNAKSTLIKNFEENVDYIISLNVQEKSKGRPSEDIYLTKDCFKQLCMLSNTEKGKAVRLYYIQCEKQVKAIYSGDYLATLKALVAAQEEKQALALEAAELRPKAEDWDSLCADKNLLNIEKVSKTLAIQGLGKIKLFEWLREQGILYFDNSKTNVPYQKYVELGYFTTRFKKNPHNNENYVVTLCTIKGFAFIKRQLIKDGYTLPPLPNAEALALPAASMTEVIAA
jgi:anti-repressor protein